MTATRRLRMSHLLETRDGTPSNKDARLTNCILEKDGNELNLIKRPGFTLNTSPASGIGYGATIIQTPDGGNQLISFVDADMVATQTMPSGTFTTTGGTVADLTGKQPCAVLYYDAKFWILNVVDKDTGLVTSAVYSSANGLTWTTETTSPAYDSVATLSNIPAVVFAGKMWVVGGENAGAATRRVLNSTDGITWTLINATPAFTARRAARLLVYNNLMWLISGVDNGGLGWQDVWYTSDGNTWTRATAAAAFDGVSNFACFVLANKMWLVGGWVSATGFHDDCYSSTDGITWTLETAAPGWSARDGMGFCVLNNFAYILGGRTTTGAGTPLSDLWRTPDGITWTQVTANVGFNTCNSQGTNLAWVGTSLFVSNGTTPYLFGYFPNTATSSTFVDTTYTAATATTNIITSGGSNALLSLGGIIDVSQTLDRTKLAIKNTTSAWEYLVNGQTLTRVTDTDYPLTTVRGLVYLNGTFYVMDKDGKIYGSAANAFTSWSALNFINAQSEPDGGVCIFKYNQYVVAFGQYTIEFFYDAGNASGSPLSPVQNSQMLIGCASADSVTQIASSILFIGQMKSGNQSLNPQVFVAKISGTSYEIISVPNIDRYLNAADLSTAYAASCVVLGHPCYVITLPASDLNLVYDMKTGSWYIWDIGTTGSAQTIGAGNMTVATQTDNQGLVTVTLTAHGFSDGDPITIAGANQSAYNGTYNITRTSANAFTYVISTVPVSPATGTITATGVTRAEWPMRCVFNYGGDQVFQDASNGSIYTMSDTTYTDNSVYIDTHARFESFDQGLEQDGNSARKFIPWMDAITDKTAATTNLLVRWTDDDFQTYSNYRTVDISLKRARMTRCGSFYRRGIEIRHTASAAHRFKGFDVGLDQGV